MPDIGGVNLLDWPNVVGYGVGFKRTGGELTDEMATVVLVTEKLNEVQLAAQDFVPEALAGQPTDVIEVGTIRALRTSKHRPAPGGVSIGHKDITAGTLGTLVADFRNGGPLILSNNHVLANSNAAKVGDPIYQPGPIDGGRVTDEIAKLERWIPIAFEGGCNPLGPSGPNLVDAAVAKPNNIADVDPSILDIGPVHGAMAAVLAQSVQKSGRTTGHTYGNIQVLNAVVTVSYGGSGNAVFEDQIITSNMSQGGDSGSLLVDAEQRLAVGLLFAGSNQVTIHNPIDAVLSSLQISL
jgi:hypothetical protein